MTSKPAERLSSRFFKDLEEFEDSDEEETNETEEKQKEANIEATRLEDKSSSNESQETVDRSDLETKPHEKITTPKDTKEHSEVKNSVKSRLPSANDCLKTQTTPEFLKSLSKQDVDCEKFHKPLPSDDPDNGAVQDYKTSAVPPPCTYEPQTDPGIKVVDSEGRKRKTINDDLADQMTSTKAYKVHPPEDAAE